MVGIGMHWGYKVIWDSGGDAMWYRSPLESHPSNDLRFFSYGYGSRPILYTKFRGMAFHDIWWTYMIYSSIMKCSIFDFTPPFHTWKIAFHDIWRPSPYESSEWSPDRIWGWVLRKMGVSISWGSPKNHPCSIGMFPYKPSIFGYSHDEL